MTQKNVLNIYKLLLITVALSTTSGCATTNGAQSIYFLGVTKHFQPTDKTNEGNMNYVAYSREYAKGDWRFENGLGTFVDSYDKRSYSIFSNISHEQYKWKYLQPVMSLQCANKGSSYDNDKRKTICAPLPKLRIGGKDKLFADLSAIPKIGTLTNGMVNLEVGYKF